MENHEIDPKLMRLASALEEARDAWVKLGMQLRDVHFEIDRNKRNEVLTEVERYLARLGESSLGGVD